MKKTMPLTYATKIDAVFDGTCRQTIRRGHNLSIGDEILFHTWSGRPYRSKWGRRKKVILTDVLYLWFSENYNFNVESQAMDRLAELDGISPPTGEALIETLERLHGGKEKLIGPWQVLRW